jgi:creatinine amidohydrolase
MHDEHSTSAAVAATPPEIAVFGIGAIEQHGRHLPIGTDLTVVSEICRRVTEELDAFLIPAIPFSMSECHGTMGGTVWLKPTTLAAVLRDVALSLNEQGFRGLLVINGHGGNFILEPVIQEINKELSSFAVVMPVDAWAAPWDGEAIFESKGDDIHAGEMETSIQLFLDPAHVKPSGEDCVPSLGREYLDYAQMPLLSPEGVWGCPELGRADKGERAMTKVVQAIVMFTHQAFGMIHQC